jgi:hypothetical protein
LKRRQPLHKYRSLSLILYKNQFKMDQISKCKNLSLETITAKNRVKILADTNIGNYSVNMISL